MLPEASFTLEDFRIRLDVFSEIESAEDEPYADKPNPNALLERVFPPRLPVWLPGLSYLPLRPSIDFAVPSIRTLGGIVDAMTSEERRNPDLLAQPNRQERIARGSGVSTGDVQALLEQFRYMEERHQWHALY